jgi:ABC-type antimicrobial peptide transport system permease subunit
MKTKEECQKTLREGIIGFLLGWVFVTIAIHLFFRAWNSDGDKPIWLLSISFLLLLMGAIGVTGGYGLIEKAAKDYPED